MYGDQRRCKSHHTIYSHCTLFTFTSLRHDDNCCSGSHCNWLCIEWKDAQVGTSKTYELLMQNFSLVCLTARGIFCARNLLSGRLLSSSNCQKHIHSLECTNAKRNVWYSSLEWKNLSPLQRPKIFRHFVKKIAETELNLCKTRRDKSRVLRGGRGHSRPRTSMSFDISAW